MASHPVKRRKVEHHDDDVDVSDHASAESTSGSEDSAPENETPKRQRKAPQSISTTASQAKSSAEQAIASGLYKTNLFKLQLDELLKSVKPNYDKQVAKHQTFLHKLKNAIDTIPSIEPCLVTEAEKKLRKGNGVSIPFPEPRPAKDSKYKFEYAKPANINVVGSLALKTGTKSAEPLTIDLAVTMPSGIFQEKDYVNFRYFHKRAYYLACIAAGLKSNEGFRLSWEYQDDDLLRPVLVAEPATADAEVSGPAKCRVRILPTIADNVFPIAKTLPSKNNIRQSLDSDSKINEEATPFYNASVRADASTTSYLKLLHTAATKCDSFRDACVLGRIWLRQRAFSSKFSQGGFGNFEWAALCALLLRGGGPNGKPILSLGYSSYQLFKAVLQFIANRDLQSPVIVLGSSSLSIPTTKSPCIFDGQRGLNILFKMTPWSYQSLRHEASATLSMLNDSTLDHFDRIFVLKVDDPLQRYDRLVQVTLPAKKQALELAHTRVSLHKMFDVLVRALGDRVNLIAMSPPATCSWQLSSQAPTPSKSVVTVGLLLDPANASRTVDHGPSAEDKEASAVFQAFWGEKSELRRFKDGSIVESLVWSSQQTGTPVVQQIIIYILGRHFSVGIEGIKFIGHEFDYMLPGGYVAHPSALYQGINESFKKLETRIREIESLPLTLRLLSPADSQLRFASVQPPTPGRTPPADVVIQFEASTRWPDDLSAIQRTKVAFLLKLADDLVNEEAASSARVGLENESSRFLNVGFLDITTTDGYIFRMRIHHDRELALLERHLADKTLAPQIKEEAGFALAAYKRDFVLSIRQTSVVRTLATRYPLLSPTIRLMKKWCNSHLFSSHLDESLIELFAVRTFLHPQPYAEAPSSIVTGFLRTLHFLSRWDWQNQPLIIDFSGEMTADDINGINTRFEAWRKIDPAMNTVALFVASDLDPEGVIWTQHNRPSKAVAGRLVSLAKAATSMVREKGIHLDPEQLFRSPLSDYDFLLHLDAKHAWPTRPKTPKIDPAVPSQFKNLIVQQANAVAKPIDEELIGFDPVSLFVQELKATFGNNIMFFYDSDGGDIIGGVWNPQAANQATSWRLKLAYSTKPAEKEKKRKSADGEESEGLVVLNKEAILNEISMLAGKLVKKVTVNRS